MSTLLIAGSFS